MKPVPPSQVRPARGPAGPSQTGGDKKAAPWSKRIKTIESLLAALGSLLRVVAIAGLVAFVFLHQDFVERWLWGLSGGEFLGLKIERSDIDDATSELQLYAAELTKSNQSKPADANISIDLSLAEDAILRAARAAPAIVNSRILRVDDKPAQNAAIQNILTKLKIKVVDVASTAEAMSAMQISPFDVIITNVWRPADPENKARKLDICRVHYFDFPDPRLETSFSSAQEIAQYGSEHARELALDRFNIEANLHGAAGYGMAETILSSPGTNSTKPQIIFFSADNARVARPMCGFRITNRADILLNSVVSILEQRNSKLLVAKPWSKESSANKH
jgi:CheY-like chemotaxis protein